MSSEVLGSTSKQKRKFFFLELIKTGRSRVVVKTFISMVSSRADHAPETKIKISRPAGVFYFLYVLSNWR